MEETKTTPFSLVYNSFLNKITDDLYLELNEVDTYRLLQDLLLSAITKFEFPKIPLDYEEEYSDEETSYSGVESDYMEVTAVIMKGGCFLSELNIDEINILSTYMIVEWLGQQLASIENTRMKYTGADFKMTSQANHMAKILTVKKDYEREGFHLQRLYKRRRLNDKRIQESTFDTIMEKSALDGKTIW